MDLLAACEALASIVVESDSHDKKDNISTTTIQRWQELFEISETGAINEISEWRMDPSRRSISIWDSIKEDRVAQGFDKESYEYSLNHRCSIYQRPSQPDNDTALYLVKLEHAIPSSSAIQSLLDLTQPLPTLPGIDDDGATVVFCQLTGIQKKNLTEVLKGNIKLTFLRVSIASKEISSSSRYPTLGVDTTLPHFRLPNIPIPDPNEYPMWYFFYGTLCQETILARAIGVEESNIKYKQARVYNAKLSTWGNKYRGLVDGGVSSLVDGMAFIVNSREEEDGLRVYETSQYEVVRCSIFLRENSQDIDGFTFRLR